MFEPGDLVVTRKWLHRSTNLSVINAPPGSIGIVLRERAFYGVFINNYEYAVRKDEIELVRCIDDV